MNINLSLNQRIVIHQSSKLCPYEIINHTGEQAVIKGFKRIHKNKTMPIVEFNDQTRMWILNEENTYFNHVSS